MTPEMAEAIVTGGGRDDLVLTVLYDERCPLCRRLKDWLGRQPALRRVSFLSAESAEAHARFPGLDHRRTTRVLTVVSSDGAVFEGERAWLVCAWALPGWQPVSEYLGQGFGLRLAAVLTRAVDGYRHRVVATGPAGACERCGLQSAP